MISARAANAQRMPAGFDHRDRTLALLPFVLFAAIVFGVLPITPDDAFITLRYAANVLDGAGAVFNAGERVEGYTSPLHLLISATLLFVFGHAKVLIAAKLIGAVVGLWLVHQTGTLAGRLGLSSAEKLVAQLLLVLNVNFAISCVDGLETPYYAAALMMLATCALREHSTGNGYASALLVTLAIALRPEAILLAPALLVPRVWLWRTNQASIHFVTRWLAGILVPLAGLIALRWLYYHGLLPNTYYAKSYDPLKAITDGARYLMRPLVALGQGPLPWKLVVSRVFIFAMAAVYWVPFVTGAWSARKSIQAATVLSVVFVELIFAAKSGGDWMYGWRYMIVAAPVIGIFQCLGVRALARRLCRAQWLPRAGAVLPMAHGLLLLFWCATLCVAPTKPWSTVGYTTSAETLLRETGSCSTDPRLGVKQVAGAMLIRSLPPGAVIATTEIGFAGFSNLDKHIVDLRGLVNREVARLEHVEHSAVGVTDPDWHRATSPLGHWLLARGVDAIVSFDDVPVALESFAQVASSHGMHMYLRRRERPLSGIHGPGGQLGSMARRLPHAPTDP